MSIIENFSTLTAQEQQQFAAELIAKINERNIFTDDFDFELDSANPPEASDMTGDLFIYTANSEEYPVQVVRSAQWTAWDYDSMDSAKDVDYHEYYTKDVLNSLKTTTAEIDGYKVTIEVEDGDEDRVVEVEVTDYSAEDAGIGSYEYFGERGYDSQPYYEVYGDLTVEGWAFFTLTVEPLN